MDNNNKNAKTLNIIGVAASILSFALYLILRNKTEIRRGDFFDEGGVFLINYMITIIYSITVISNNTIKNRFWQLSMIDRRQIMYMVTLFSISAFTLNLSIPIFNRFTAWLDTYLLIMFLPLFILGHSKTPQFLKYIAYFLMGLGTVMSLYFAIYLLPMFVVMIIGAIFFGLGLHLIAPHLLLLTYIVQFRKEKSGRTGLVLYLSGIILPLIVFSFYMNKWHDAKMNLHKASASIITQANSTLPTWVILSQNLSSDPFSEKIIMGELRYDTPQRHWDSFGFPSNSFSEIKEHDPMVFMSMAFLGDLPIDRNDRIKVLESKFDSRHLSYRKFWTGRDLSTTEVLTNLDVFPDYRMAYLEKYITIQNHNSWAQNQQEALYTFYLPEGSVATSLSLWINGREEKSRLTTRQKADSAYSEIVGRQRRDPALLHWQEGNRITVTVFPCTPAENRRFRVGFTMPLEKRGDELILKNVNFKGPWNNSSLETTAIRIHSQNGAKFLDLPSVFEQTGTNEYQYTGSYRSYWELRISDEGLSKNQFSFNGKSFSVKDHEPENEIFKAEKIYLDINKSWSKGDIEDVLEIIGDRPFYVVDVEPAKVTEENREYLIEQGLDKEFSLFPIHLIDDPRKSLIISKSSHLSPNLRDLKESVFGDSLKSYLEGMPESIPFYNIDNQVSPYIASLREFGIFHFSSGSIDELRDLISKNEFPEFSRDTNRIVIHESDMEIIMNKGEVKSKAPDHVMRLFAYNQINHLMGAHYFESDEYVTGELIDLANEAFVVSPISSLVVLETLQDYERFGIEENENSLQNAASGSSGAVPEPHEWALIILIGLTLLYLTYKRRMNTLN